MKNGSFGLLSLRENTGNTQIAMTPPHTALTHEKFPFVHCRLEVRARRCCAVCIATFLAPVREG